LILFEELDEHDLLEDVHELEDLEEFDFLD
jgi:hypothetical protein